MVRSAALILLLASCAASGAEIAGDDMRPIDAAYISKVPRDDLERCTIRLVGRAGDARTVPVEGGIAVDMTFKSFLSLPGKNSASFVFTAVDGGQRITALYRHPLSAKAALGFLKDLIKHCDPAAEPVAG